MNGLRISSVGTDEAPAGAVGMGTGVGGWSSALGVDATLVGAGGVSTQPMGRGGTGTKVGVGPVKEEPSVVGLDATSVGVSGVPTCPVDKAAAGPVKEEPSIVGVGCHFSGHEWSTYTPCG